MPQSLLTTSVGSFPKPDYLRRARAQYARQQISAEELSALERKATEHWIRVQEEIGIDVLVDGEMYRGDMATYFAENMDGFRIGGLVRSYGNRYYRKPIAIGAIGLQEPITVERWKYAQGLTKKPVKGMITGPYTIADWSFDEHYSSRETFVMDLARALRKEVLALQEAGCEYIQIDEPAISVLPGEMPLAKKALQTLTEGVSAYTLTHMCYGDFAAVGDELVSLPVDNIDLEMANSDYALLDVLEKHGFEKTVSAGVVDSHSHEIESKDQVKRGILRILEKLPPERVWVDPDCGLKTRTEDETISKLKVIVEAAREVRRERGVS